MLAQQVACEKSDRQLFSDINIALYSSQLLYVTGENGAGKTSLLRILVGLSLPSNGAVEVNGYDIHKNIHDGGEHLLYFGHKQGISQLLTATENLKFWCQLHGFDLNHDAIHTVFAEPGLTGLEYIAGKNLPSGPHSRISFPQLRLQPSSTERALE